VTSITSNKTVIHDQHAVVIKKRKWLATLNRLSTIIVFLKQDTTKFSKKSKLYKRTKPWLLLTDCAVADETHPRVGDTFERPGFIGRVAFDAYCFVWRRGYVHVARQRRVRAAEHCSNGYQSFQQYFVTTKPALQVMLTSSL